MRLSFSRTVLIYDCCPRVIIHSTPFTFKSVLVWTVKIYGRHKCDPCVQDLTSLYETKGHVLASYCCCSKLPQI